MALYNNPEVKKYDTQLCHTGFTCSERIMFHPTQEDIVFLGYKTFHCLKRFCFEKGPLCLHCRRDMTKECFRLDKTYDSQELLETIILSYIDRCDKGIGDSVIWWDDKYAGKIVKCLSKQPNIVETHAKGSLIEEDKYCE
jgi:hypothetical protein